jgi:peptide/nickel transport system permease protein
MLAEGKSCLHTAWWLTLFPGLMLALAVLGINLLGDGLRDLSDPVIRRC